MIIIVGTNNLSKQSARKTAADLKHVVTTIEEILPQSTILISEILPKKHPKDFKEKAHSVNRDISAWVENRTRVKIIKFDATWDEANLFTHDNLHLTETEGIASLVAHMKHILNPVLGLPQYHIRMRREDRTHTAENSHNRPSRPQSFTPTPKFNNSFARQKTTYQNRSNGQIQRPRNPYYLPHHNSAQNIRANRYQKPYHPAASRNWRPEHRPRNNRRYQWGENRQRYNTSERRHQQHNDPYKHREDYNAKYKHREDYDAEYEHREDYDAEYKYRGDYDAEYKHRKDYDAEYKHRGDYDAEYKHREDYDAEYEHRVDRDGYDTGYRYPYQRPTPRERAYKDTYEWGRKPIGEEYEYLENGYPRNY